MATEERRGPAAPKDPTKKKPYFYIMYRKDIHSNPQPDGKGVQFLFQSDGRLESSARVVGKIENEEMIQMLGKVESFRKLVHSIGIIVETENREEEVDFVFQMYGKTDPYVSGTILRKRVKGNGMEELLVLEECEWTDDDDVVGQIRVEFDRPEIVAQLSVKLYLQDGFDAPEPKVDADVDFTSSYYQEMLQKSLFSMGNGARIKKLIQKAKAGEDVLVAFIGGSITQGAGAVPINKKCYAYLTYTGICELLGKGTDENIHYSKAGLGGTSSELGMVRFERDVLKEGNREPDLVVIEFAVNDEGDETKGECYDSLVRKVYEQPNHPAVILLFAVFANDWNLQERLSPVGYAYNLPMVSVRDAVVEQFYKKEGEGMVATKNQFFYDSYHPTNIGHRVMADCILTYMKKVMEDTAVEEDFSITDVKPPLGGDFEKVTFFDKKEIPSDVVIDEGDFTDTDTELQAAEMDTDLTGTPEFPNNWMYIGEKHAGKDAKVFAMDIECSSLFLVYKDSASVTVGCAEVLCDGEVVLTVNPREIGWTHCSSVISFRNKELKKHHVEVRMVSGDEDKNFTILGWAYVR